MPIFSLIIFFVNTLIKRIFTGLTVPQQYVCVAREELKPTLSVALTLSRKNFFTDVTQSHLFLGYKPLIIGIIGDDKMNAIKNEDNITLEFLSTKPTERIASLSLKRIFIKKVGDKDVLFFEGVSGRHKLLNGVQQFINNQREKFRNVKDPNNIALSGNLYDMVRIAYSTPRLISVVTVSDGNKMNMFPTDLHGKISDRFYISSLRINGKANEQVEQLGRIVLSNVAATEFKNVYSLGKNHMRELQPVVEFKGLDGLSESFKFPLPSSVLEYKELKRIDSFDHGVHRIHLYEIVSEKKIAQGSALAHIHQYYAQWRLNNKMQTEMLLR